MNTYSIITKGLPKESQKKSRLLVDIFREVSRGLTKWIFKGLKQILQGPLGVLIKFHKAPLDFQRAWDPKLQAPSSSEPSDYSLCLILLSTSMPWKLPVYPNTAPQLGHRRCRMMRQQRMPMGKKKIAQHTPRQVKSSSKTPVWKDIGINSVWLRIKYKMQSPWELPVRRQRPAKHGLVNLLYIIMFENPENQVKFVLGPVKVQNFSWWLKMYWFCHKFMLLWLFLQALLYKHYFS